MSGKGTDNPLPFSDLLGFLCLFSFTTILVLGFVTGPAPSLSVVSSYGMLEGALGPFSPWATTHSRSGGHIIVNNNLYFVIIGVNIARDNIFDTDVSSQA